jgi:bifunctional N-acetylglucosamine-1-phosphate-uridyltransferase/glucosamine-1-phosphate-acetyltransferase GlmU-like protein
MTHIIILAGGKGVRMKCDSPKVLIETNGRALIEHLLANIAPAYPRPTIIVGYKGDEVIARLGADKYDYVWQKDQLGTGHAVAAAKANLQDKNINNIVVLYGDHPRVTAGTVSKLVETRTQNDATIGMGTIAIPNYEGDYGVFDRFSRVLRGDNGEVIGSVEFKDATDEQKKIPEVNPSYYCFDAKWLWDNIGALDNQNASREYYLPDLIQRAFDQTKKVVAVPIDPVEGMGANTPEELEIISRYLK